jgi:hypothetical protein
MAWTTSDVQKLEKAIASGVTSVRYADRTVQYQDLDAMRRARREMLDEIAAAAGTCKRRTFRVTQTGTGL